MLDGLEGADRPAELVALLGVGDGEIGLRRRDAHEQRSGESRRLESGGRNVCSFVDSLSLGKRRDTRYRSEGIERQSDRLTRNRILADQPDALGIDHRDRVGRVEVGDHEVIPMRECDSRLVEPEGLREVSPDERPRHQRAPKLLEHDHRRSHPETEHAGIFERLPRLRGNTTRRFEPAHRLHREHALAQVADRRLQRALVLVEVEVHDGSFGMPSTRSDRMLRWICVVPAAMEIDIAWIHPRT